MATSYYSEEELKAIGFKSYGNNFLLSRHTQIYGASKMTIGDNVRIDDFCVISGKVTIGNYVHIAVGCSVFAGDTGVVFENFSGVSSHSAIYAESDDYSGQYLTNPTVSEKYRNIIKGPVLIGKHVIIGTGSTILPEVSIGEGSSIGSMSLVNKSLAPWGIYVGVPCKYLKERSKKLLELEQLFLNNEKINNE